MRSLSEAIAMITLLCCALGVMGCGAASLPDPADTARAFARAVSSRDAARVHAMLDADTRARVDVTTIARLLEAEPVALDALAEALTRNAELATQRARVPLGGGDVTTLVVEERAYRIDGGALALVTLSTPEDAVAALRSALLRGDLGGLLRVLSRESRSDVETELARVLEETADTLDVEIEASGDAALVRLTGGRTLHLVREDGEWHVVDLP